MLGLRQENKNLHFEGCRLGKKNVVYTTTDTERNGREAWNSSWQRILVHGLLLPCDVLFLCPFTNPICWGNTLVHGVFYHLFLAFVVFLETGHKTYVPAAHFEM